jgi:hypothetical protein
MKRILVLAFVVYVFVSAAPAQGLAQPAQFGMFQPPALNEELHKALAACLQVVNSGRQRWTTSRTSTRDTPDDH